MKLIGSAASPYVRKVRVVMAEKRLDYQFVIEDVWSPDTTIASSNPLGKVPCLIMEGSEAMFDSRVIVEYLDTVSPVSRLIPEPSRQRIAVKRWEALADGICDATAAMVQERKRPAAIQSPEWIARQQQKVTAGVAELAHDLADKAWCNGEGYTLADIATGCALGYLDLRHPDFDWRDSYSNLSRLADKLAKRAAFQDTAPPGP
jgi:glutathione S-transferase